MEIKIFRGSEISAIIQDVSFLRCAIFAEYPYLYDGNEVDEHAIFSAYATIPEARVAALFDESKMIGAATGIPLKDYQDSSLRTPFEAYNVPDIYYWSDFLLLKPYRGGGLGRMIESAMTDEIETLPYPLLALCMIHREKTDPLRPNPYFEMSDLVTKRGFKCLDTVPLCWKWRCNVTHKDEPHTLFAWIKKISKN